MTWKLSTVSFSSENPRDLRVQGGSTKRWLLQLASRQFAGHFKLQQGPFANKNKYTIENST